MSNNPGVKELVKATRGLRDELTAYRWTLERWLKRGRRAFIAVIIMLVFVLVAAGGSVYAAWHTDRLVQQVERNQRIRAEQVEEHRARNEMLHACLVELVLDIINTPREQRGTGFESPCPDPLPTDEL